MTTTFIEQSPILTVVCDEPDGPVVRRVYPMLLTVENIRKFWDKAKGLKTVFAGEISGDFHKFAELFLSQDGNMIRPHGLFWVIDDFVGLLYMDRITSVDAYAHYIFFDGRHRGRSELVKEMLAYVFRKFGFQRLSVEIPLYSGESIFKFVLSLGFRREGKKRNAVHYRDQWFTVACFGLLREEALAIESSESKNGSES